MDYYKVLVLELAQIAIANKESARSVALRYVGQLRFCEEQNVDTFTSDIYAAMQVAMDIAARGENVNKHFTRALMEAKNA